jgi:LacI family transcriptional regulator
LLERNVDGVIIAGKVDEKLVDYIDSLGLPLVLVDYELPRRRVSSVLIDNRKGGHEATLHLLQAGHKDIGFIGGDLEHPSIAERFAAFKETLLENEVPVNDDLIVVDEKDTQLHNGYGATKKMLANGGRPTAIFAANDAMAIGCMRYLRHAGIKVPEDIAVVGFDDVDMGSHVEPRLTTVRVFKEEMGKLAVQRLVEVFKTKSKTVVTTLVPVELTVRESSGAPVPGTSEELILSAGDLPI